jgi:bifunctional DNase/RNase
MEHIKMDVAGLTVDPTNDSPIVILRDEKGEYTLPIWIGILEASAIATQLENVNLARPMTHDLLVTMLNSLKATVQKIVVSDLRDNTYFARIHLVDQAGRKFDLDARPSDSIALALRVKAQIFVDKSVLERANLLDENALKNLKKTVEDKWKELLDNIDPDDLGKYRM